MFGLDSCVSSGASGEWRSACVFTAAVYRLAETLLVNSFPDQAAKPCTFKRCCVSGYKLLYCIRDSSGFAFSLNLEGDVTEISASRRARLRSLSLYECNIHVE